MSRQTLYAILACAVLALSVVPIGTAAFVLGFLHGESPCILCWAQRTGMVLVALVGIFILRFGPRPRYIGLGVLIAAHGLYMAARHSALHLARDVGQGFAGEILGAHTYVWSALIFWVCVLAMGTLLLLVKDGEAAGEVRDPGPLGRAAMLVFLVAVAGNLVQAFASTGPPPFLGQSDPVRFSFDPRRWVWSLDEWKPAPISWRGRWDIEKPGLDGRGADPRQGPLGELPRLGVKRRLAIAPALNGAVTDLAYDAAGDRFLATTDAHGVYLLDGELARVLRYTVVDPAFSVDLGGLEGAAWLDGRTFMALSSNKSFVILEEADRAGPEQGFRHFLESSGSFAEVARSRFSTVRARMMYVMSLAYDPAGDSFYTLSVPNRRHKRLVVSRFARADLTLSEEYLPRIAAASGLRLAGEKRSLDECYVTGAAIEAGRLYAVDAAYGTLLVLDLAARELVAAYAIEGLARPSGLALRRGELLVAAGANEVLVVDRP